VVKGDMPGTIEERVAYLEGKVEEHSKAWEDLKDMLIHLDQKVDRFREELSGRMDGLDHRLSSRMDGLDQKVDRFREELSGRMDALDHRLSSRMDALDQRLSSRLDGLDQKFSRYFLWIIGIQVTIFLAIIATFLR